MLMKQVKIEWSDITQKLNVLKGRFFVYALYDSNHVVYIGRTKNLSTRLQYHKYRKEFQNVILVECNTESYSAYLEKKLTQHYQPKYNRLWVEYGTN